MYDNIFDELLNKLKLLNENIKHVSDGLIEDFINHADFSLFQVHYTDTIKISGNNAEIEGIVNASKIPFENIFNTRKQ